MFPGYEVFSVEAGTGGDQRWGGGEACCRFRKDIFTPPYAPVPYFWSDQYDLKLQAHGYLRGHDEVHVAEGDLTSRRLIALYRRGPALTGVLAVGAAKALRQWRYRIEAGMNWEDAIGLT